jgi:phosphonate transport system permease protein
VSSATAVRRPFPWGFVVTIVVVAVAVLLAAMRLRLDLAPLFGAEALDGAKATFGRLWPPRLDAETVTNLRSGIVETLSMSIVGTALGAAMGFVLMPFCCETLLVRGPLVDEERRPLARLMPVLAVHHGARFVANVLRTVPYFVWAMLFWFMVGQGTFPGALALAVHTAGVIARNYAQVLDDLDQSPNEALRSAGVRRAHVFLFGMLPAARASLASFTLYRWEVNLRESAVLGLVGTVGLGWHMKYAIGIFDWRAAATHLAGIILLVLLVDALSAWLRRRLL